MRLAVLGALLAAAPLSFSALAEMRGPDCAHVLAIPGVVTTEVGGDVIALAPHRLGALLCYHNGPQVSAGERWSISLDGVTVEGEVIIGDAETFVLRLPPGYVAQPAIEAEQVPDMSAITVLIFSGLM